MAQRPLARGAAPAGAVLPAVPTRAVGRPAPARGDRRRARPRPRGHRGRRTRVEPRRLRARRDPPAADEAPRDELGLTIIIVTHDLGLAWTVADRVAVMYLGRIVEIGPTEEVLLRPLHPYTKALLDVVPEAGGLDRPILTGEPPDPTRIPQGCRFHPRCPVVVVGEGGRARDRGRVQGRGPGAGGTRHRITSPRACGSRA